MNLKDVMVLHGIADLKRGGFNISGIVQLKEVNIV